MEDIQTYDWRGPLTVLAGGICIGFAPIFMVLGLGEEGSGYFEPQAIAFWRYLFSVPVLFLMVLCFQKRLPLKPNRFVILGGIFFALDIALWHWALDLTTVANATFIVNLGNIGVGFLAWIFLKERLTIFWTIAIVLALTGAAALSQGGVEGGQGDLRGDLLALAAAFFVSCYILCSKIARKTLSGLEAIFWLTLVELMVAYLVVLVAGESFLPENPKAFIWPLLLALVVQIGGQGLIITGLGQTPASIAGVLILAQPVVATMAAWFIFDQSLGGFQIMGCVLILLAIWLSQQKSRIKSDG